ncbi:MAG: hypothetical protein NZ821_05650 [Gloeomargarita sp. SKYB31]|nr:hypothetical protein [Gloeomargarita sp. SKYB31]
MKTKSFAIMSLLTILVSLLWFSLESRPISAGPAPAKPFSPTKLSFGHQSLADRTYLSMPEPCVEDAEKDYKQEVEFFYGAYDPLSGDGVFKFSIKSELIGSPSKFHWYLYSFRPSDEYVYKKFMGLWGGKDEYYGLIENPSLPGYADVVYIMVKKITTLRESIEFFEISIKVRTNPPPSEQDIGFGLWISARENLTSDADWEYYVGIRPWEGIPGRWYWYIKKSNSPFPWRADDAQDIVRACIMRIDNSLRFTINTVGPIQGTGGYNVNPYFSWTLVDENGDERQRVVAHWTPFDGWKVWLEDIFSGKFLNLHNRTRLEVHNREMVIEVPLSVLELTGGIIRWYAAAGFSVTHPLDEGDAGVDYKFISDLVPDDSEAKSDISSPVPTPTRARVPTPTFTPAKTPTPQPTVIIPTATSTPPSVPTAPVPLSPIPAGGFWIKDMRVEYTGSYPSQVHITITNRSTSSRGGILTIRWEGAGMSGLVGTRQIFLNAGESSIVTFDLGTLHPKASLLRAEINGSSYQVHLKTPSYPPSNEYQFELYPSPNNATELRVITPEGHVYTFPVRKVKITLDTSQVPEGFTWHRTSTYLQIPAPFPECAIRAFLPWWIEVFLGDPEKAVGTEIINQLVDAAAEQIGYTGPIPVSILLDVAELAHCVKGGLRYPVNTAEVYLIINDSAHIIVEYEAGTFTTTYVWRGRGEWAGFVTANTDTINITIVPDRTSPLCKWFTWLPICTRTVCNSSGHNEMCFWERFYVLNNQSGLVEYADCVRHGWRQHIQVSSPSLIIEHRWENARKNNCDKQVKGFPAIVAGWHYWDQPMDNYPEGYLTPIGVHSLPAHIGERKQFKSSFQAIYTGRNSKLNLLWKIWIAPTPEPGNRGKPNSEVRVLVWHTGQQPGSEKREYLGTIALQGERWNLYRGWNENGWWVFTFVRQMGFLESLWSNPVVSGVNLSYSMNLEEFLQYLVNQGLLSSGDWIVGIEFGPEIIQGTGSWRINRYTLEP